MSVVLLTAFLIHNLGNKVADDKIVATLIDSEVHIVYTEYESENQVKKKYQLVLRKDQFVGYVKNLCVLFTTDTEPFRAFQLNFNGYPTYMASRNSMTRSVIKMLTNMAEMVASDLRHALPPPICNNSSFYECEDY